VRDAGEPWDATDVSGGYDITGLAAGIYTVTVESGTVPAGYVLTTGNDPMTVSLSAGEDYNDADFGYWQPATIGDFVWEDVDGDGLQDVGESGLSGVTVTLYGSGGVFVDSTSTDADGYYTFTDVVSGSYYVVFTGPAGYVFSLRDQGGDDSVDSDADASGQTGIFTVTSGETKDDVDAGLRRQVDLSLTKDVDNSTPNVGDEVVFTLVISNGGPSTATGVAVSDTLPAGVSYVGSTATEGTYSDSTNQWTGLNLSAGEAQTLTITATVTAAGSYTNVAEVETADQYDPDSTPGNSDPTEDDQDEATLTAQEADLRLTKEVVPGEAAPNMPFSYTIRITNTGEVTFTSMVLTDTLPQDFHYIIGSGSPDDPDLIAEPLLIWQDLGSLSPGDSLSVSFAVTATSGITGTYWNEALVEGQYPGGVVTSTDDAPVSIEDPAVMLSKRVVAIDRDEWAPNYVTFTVAITNVGPSVIDVLPLLDQYDPSYLSFEDATPYPEDDVDDGTVAWSDLTGPAPYGFGRDLGLGEAFVVTTVFRVVSDINITTTNIATVTNAVDVYENPANDYDDDEEVWTEGDEGIPTPLELLYFWALPEESAIRLEWATAAELDVLGFRIYRAPDESFAHAQIVKYLSAAGGDSTYVHIDRDVAPGQPYWYWLAEVATDGSETLHRPAQTGVRALLPYRVYLPLIRRR
jgi:uncharacterized repeat protein (TIGR01451 family)